MLSDYKVVKIDLTRYRRAKTRKHNPFTFTGSDVEGPLYNIDGTYVGGNRKTEKDKDVAFTGTAVRDDQGGIIGYENLVQFTAHHTQFQTISQIVKHEGVTMDPQEYLWIAHTANNAAVASGTSLYNKLMSSYSSVPKKEKVPLSTSDNSPTAKFARAGVLHVLSGGIDPTAGATLWDGTDFLAWGLVSPNGTPQNKFEEYRSISISKDIYNGYLRSNLNKYTRGRVRYAGTYYTIPASVFQEQANWVHGNFFYHTGAKQVYSIEATGNAGISIFWRKVK